MGPSTLRELAEQMRLRWEELMVLSAGPDMYGSEILDGQLVELEMWMSRIGRMGEVERAA
ncbi:hypothetical protein A8924_3916 [Saccharopolyspora erythraea NRRL 2338]|uniref:Uncharacterized protein n=2 Tax=Saccharopolyspora erythraea TaxID=1836 RepID=A4FFH2_SACEN|nr:hypothetical protein [Saccharopolyspora erythraea]EQD82110.1 hypothetical protein N599_32465 [Saccharopolyspora erythraea D]PFG96518.1 hypothetical protein A8924_3916 [Saccharopolyspora erythraea NRRL 2338]QRK93009.1 hypothetical protein JQX30_17995 [Saccharopolyspora erythraea]CAM02797.1 hypothetical protein SACE_3523 [Saccharopolyspora erythraea NRRL 2338]